MRGKSLRGQAESVRRQSVRGEESLRGEEEALIGGASTSLCRPGGRQKALSPSVAFLLFGLSAQAGSAVEVPAVVTIPAGSFIAGSDAAERDLAYRLDEIAYGSPVTRAQRWYEAERARGHADTGAYAITMTPITNRQYAEFIATTGYPAPDVDRKTWESYDLIHPYARTQRHAWRGNHPPAGREQHPVVLVKVIDVLAYAGWLTKRTGTKWRLPTELEWEKAARGTDGPYFPWGNEFDAARLNSADAGPFDTTPVDRYRQSASPFGLLDAAGQVYEWTATVDEAGRAIVKGGSWDDRGCGVCRPAARHARPTELKHILIGFRLVRE